MNLVLNYLYEVLAARCGKSMNILELESSVRFLHDFSNYQTKQSLVYDLMEPFRFLGDLTTIQAFESGILDLKDFYFTGDDYSYKIEIEAKRRFLQLLKERFNVGVKYKGKNWKWDTVIEQKTMALARYIAGKSRLLDFSGPEPELARMDNIERWKCILGPSGSEARRLGIRKSAFDGAYEHVSSNRALRVHQKVTNRATDELETRKW